MANKNYSQQNIESIKVELEQRKTTAEINSKVEELALRREELELRKIESGRASRFQFSPLSVTVIAGSLSLLTAAITSYSSGLWSLQNQKEKNANELKLQQDRNTSEIMLKEKEHQFQIMLKAAENRSIEDASRNLLFFVDIGFLSDPDGKIRRSVLAGKVPFARQPFEVPEISRIYNFPTQLDGTGQTIGILNFGGGYRQTEIADYFASANVPAPQITDVSVDQATNAPNGINDSEVVLGIEIVGALAPNASIRVYFSHLTKTGFVAALDRAVADGVSVISICWGKSESRWNKDEIRAIDDALQAATEKGVTIVVAVGDDGVTNLEVDGKPHVSFPASSPWVLAVGGTDIVANGHQIESETVWNDKFSGATGGGVSESFERPAWQAAVNGPSRNDGKAGRVVPDVAALAAPSLCPMILLNGKRVHVGGTSVSTYIWASLIAIVNQGLGHNLGYLNPMLYQQAGPSGVLTPVTKGDNGFGAVKGYVAGPGWNSVAGWGTPNGTKLLEWLRRTPADGKNPVGKTK